MSTFSIIYKNIYIYRLVMNLLYLGKNKNRFQRVIEQIKDEDKSVVELCFGDIAIAQFCRKNEKKWQGIDINQDFVRFAQSNGFKADVADIFVLTDFPKADVLIIQASLYHFINDLDDLFRKMLQTAKKIIIAECIVALANMGGAVGWISKRAVGVGKGDEEFRFDESSFLEMLNNYKTKFNFEYTITSKQRDIVVVITHGKK